MTDEQIEKTIWLNRAYHADKKIESLRAIKKESVKLSENFGIDESDLKIDAEIERLKSIRTETMNIINSVQDDELETILNYRYLAYMSTQDIADAMNYDIKTIQRKHKKALDKLVLNVAQ